MRALAQILDRWMRPICKVADYVAGALILVLTIDVFAEVVFRYMLGMPIRFSSELAMIVFPWMVFLSSVMITRNDEHIGIVIFRHAQRGLRRKIVEIVIYLGMAGFSVAMMIAGWELAMGIRGNILPITGMSKTLLYISVPIAFALYIPILVSRIAKVLAGDDADGAGSGDPADEACHTV
jgi:TRAP-type C4-dicarboxylate transport system permease small subunit